MSGTSNESEDGMFAKYHTDSPLIDDVNGESFGGGVILKKGPWTSNEDTILMEYVKKHGEGNWNAVQKHSGLSRCGKSCRLRWANHLRPNLRKGAFTQEEEALILELHAKMGNKWARMASYLPGRTDNEIKNYWNTRVKRRQRAGLPLYPSDLSRQVCQENHQGENTGTMSSGDLGQHDSLQDNPFEIPEVVFDGLRTSREIYSYISGLTDTNMFLKSMPSPAYSFSSSQAIHRQKRFRESCNEYLNPTVPVQNSFSPQIDQYQDGTYQNFFYGFGDPFPRDLDPCQSLLLFDSTQGVHSLPNGNFSASIPANGDVKLELPSLQYPDTDSSMWGISSPLPLLESADSFIQSPPHIDVSQPDFAIPENSGLLDALIQEARHLSRVKKHSPEKSLISSSPIPGDMAGDNNLNFSVNEWYRIAEPMSPFGQSGTSIFNECISPGVGSFEDAPPAETFPGKNLNQHM